MEPGVEEWVEGIVLVNEARWGRGWECLRSRYVNIAWRVRKMRAWMWSFMRVSFGRVDGDVDESAAMIYLLELILRSHYRLQKTGKVGIPL